MVYHTARRLRALDAEYEGLVFGRLDLASAWKYLESMKTAGSPLFQSKAFSLEACFRAEQSRKKQR